MFERVSSSICVSFVPNFEIQSFCRSSDNLQQVHVNDPNIHNKIHFAKPITLITHGWLGNHSSFWMVQTASDILKYTNNSVCIVAWDHLASYVYPQVAQQHAPLVSDYMTRFVKFLNQQGMPPESMTLVGHSIGAHVCGQVGYNLKGKIREIYGLDPAGPLFTHPTRRESSFRLDSTDAGYVQMIVTTRFILGVNYGDGHENFYPNGGTSPQKSCELSGTSSYEWAQELSCSHSYATVLFQRSINPAINYTAKQCRNWVLFMRGFCNARPTDILGVRSRKITGDFYLAV